jgi:hypothetical protein
MAEILIASFFAVGTVFGLATYRIRHLLGEGPSSAADVNSKGGAGALAFWVCIASALWPVLALSGLLAGWKRRARAARG